MKKTLFLFLAVVVLMLQANGQAPEKKRYKVTKTIETPVIDGILDDDAWLQGEWVDDFTQFEPFNGRNASQRTEFKILFDDNNIYVAIKAFETAPDSIVSRLTRRDDVDGDMVGVAIDSYHDLRTAFMFGMSAGGVKFDQVMTNDGQNEDSTWDPNWWGKTSIDSEGWYAEMKIPLSQLRFEKNSDGIWGLEVYRQLYRKNELSFWQHIPKDAPGLVHMMGEMEVAGQIKPRKIFDVTPYGVTSLDMYPRVTGNPFATGRDYRFNGGLDAKIGVTNNLTLDLSIYPDFGQVEADPSEVNLTAFETFFEEKRPFFVEGNNITNFSIGLGDGGIGNDNLFYSRRIGRKPQGFPTLGSNEFSDVPRTSPIIGAAKLTGKTKNGLSIGFIETVTAEVKAEIDNEGERSFQTVEPLTNYFVGRVQKDNNQGNTIFGGMVTAVNRDLTDNLENSLHNSAYSGGVDFTQYFKEKSWMLNINAAMSYVSGSELALVRTQRSSARYFQRPDAEHFSLDSTRTSLTGTGGRMQLVKSGNSHWSAMAAFVWKSPEFEVNDIGYMRDADNIIQVLWVGYRQWEPKGFYRSYNFGFNQYSAWNFGGKHMVDGLNANGSITFKNFWSGSAGGELNFNSVSGATLRGGPLMKSPASIYSWYNMGTDSRKKLVVRVNTGLNRGFNESTSNTRISGTITYKPSENGDGTADYSFGKPDFNMQEFLSNLVIRWEYNPGSSVYLVWSQTRSNFDSSTEFSPGENLGDLFSVKPYNVFLIKFSYRFGLK
jgi:hypothetical protein